MFENLYLYMGVPPTTTPSPGVFVLNCVIHSIFGLLLPTRKWADRMISGRFST